ncbi:MAG: ABC transporter permease subunit [Lentisphaeria bacterium]|nr:ABC transporter permease subunit [Candidatus Neomarinimicrobiota bacterium]MCF7842205.1 ABC transporter permease subunit [Lentisphaeria bacterium]
MIARSLIGFCIMMLAAPLLAIKPAGEPIVVGSKKFTESVILGEIITQTVNQTSFEAIHRRELGGTRVLWNALQGGDIQIYPEYTGTIREEILSDLSVAPGMAALRDSLRNQGIGMLAPLGFNNTYALGMLSQTADTLNINRISDLKRFPDLVLGFTNEFMDRSDGWPGLKRAYQLPHSNVRGLDHDLAYRGLANGNIHVIDVYSTDAEIDYYQLKTLVDDLMYFPEYQAVILYRLNLDTEAPGLISKLKSLLGTIDAATMSQLNGRVKLERQPEGVVASEWINDTFGITSQVVIKNRWQRIWERTVEHLFLVAIALGAAILLALPLGIWSAYHPKTGQGILAVVGIIQTIPSLALLVFMIPLLGIGGPPAIFALFLYGLLPIVRNTYTGLKSIEPGIQESALALGLPWVAVLWKIDLPLASRAILAGIKTSAVICIGTATLGALIGAGGYGQPILTGIRLDNMGLILEGAVPAAVMALVVQGLFELSERWLVPKGIRLKISD